MNSKTIAFPTCVDAPENPLADEDLSACFRALYRRLLRQSPVGQLVRIVGITGCGRGVGVSTVSGGLAAAASKDGEGRILLVDASASAVGPDGNAVEEWGLGLGDVVFGSCSIDQVLHPTSRDNLWILPAGTMQPPRTTRGALPLAVELLGGLLLEFSFIVVDMAPVDELNGGRDVTPAVDGVLLVVEAGSTTKNHVRRAKQRLAGTRLLGSVLNKCQHH